MREISNYIDGDVSVVLKREIEIHFIGCDTCKLVFIQLKTTIEIFSGSDLVEFPPEMHTRLHNALRRKMQEGRL
jgi:hypothetical protein